MFRSKYLIVITENNQQNVNTSDLCGSFTTWPHLSVYYKTQLLSPLSSLFSLQKTLFSVLKHFPARPRVGVCHMCCPLSRGEITVFNRRLLFPEKAWWRSVCLENQ